MDIGMSGAASHSNDNSISYPANNAFVQAENIKNGESK
jgi:hypothetical protein